MSSSATSSTQSDSIQSILSLLSEGKRITLKFLSPKEREAFRTALYKAKRSTDEILLMTDPEFEPAVLRFNKIDRRFADSELGTLIAAEIYLMEKSEQNKKEYAYDIIKIEDSPNGG